MSDKVVERTIQVPKNTGLAGFLHTITEVLRQPYVQSLQVDTRGNVNYRVIVQDGESDDDLHIQFSHLVPSQVIRNATVEELLFPSHVTASEVLAQIFDRIAYERMKPIALVLGTESSFWPWYASTSWLPLSVRTSICGLSVLEDGDIPDDAFLVCAGFSTDDSLINTKISFKVAIPADQPLLELDPL